MSAELITLQEYPDQSNRLAGKVYQLRVYWRYLVARWSGDKNPMEAEVLSPLEDVYWFSYFQSLAPNMNYEASKALRGNLDHLADSGWRRINKPRPESGWMPLQWRESAPSLNIGDNVRVSAVVDLSPGEVTEKGKITGFTPQILPGLGVVINQAESHLIPERLIDAVVDKFGRDRLDVIRLPGFSTDHISNGAAVYINGQGGFGHLIQLHRKESKTKNGMTELVAQVIPFPGGLIEANKFILEQYGWNDWTARNMLANGGFRQIDLMNHIGGSLLELGLDRSMDIVDALSQAANSSHSA